MDEIIQRYKRKTIIFLSVGGGLLFIGFVLTVAASLIFKINSNNLSDEIFKTCNALLRVAILVWLVSIPFLVIGITGFFRKLQNARQAQLDQQNPDK